MKHMPAAMPPAARPEARAVYVLKSTSHLCGTRQRKLVTDAETATQQPGTCQALQLPLTPQGV